MKNNNSNILETSGFIDIGDICNAKCYFCFNEEGPLFYTKEDLFKKIDNYITKGIYDIRYGVGEFTMHPNFFDIIEYGYHKGIQQYIHSNGIKFSDELFVKKMSNLGIDKVNLSLHGIKSNTNDKILGVKGSFYKVIKGIKNLKKYGIKISLSFVITNDNVNEILGIYLFSLKYNISLLKFSFLTGQFKYKKKIIPNLNIIKKELKKVFLLNKKIELDIKLLNIPFCLLNIKCDKFIFENGSNSISNKEKDCIGCKYKKECSGFPLYYHKNDYNTYIKKYINHN